jgi:LYR motif-containing protein 4
MSSSSVVGVTKSQLLSLYRKLLRSAATFPSKNRAGLYQSIRAEWRDHAHWTAEEHATKINRQIQLAYQGLTQLRQFDKNVMTGGNVGSASWNVTLEQNPMPKPADYDERRAAAAAARKGKTI